MTLNPKVHKHILVYMNLVFRKPSVCDERVLVHNLSVQANTENKYRIDHTINDAKSQSSCTILLMIQISSKLFSKLVLSL